MNIGDEVKINPACVPLYIYERIGDAVGTVRGTAGSGKHVFVRFNTGTFIFRKDELLVRKK